MGDEVGHLAQQMLKLEGWCTPEKFTDMYNLVVQARPEVCVEIGVFGGRSLAALAAGCKAVGRGHVWGIDPYAVTSSAEGYEVTDANREWWSKLDYDAVHNRCVRGIREMGLAEWATVVRETAKQAVPRFQGIDMLHIDGNHSEEASVSDVALYVPLVAEGGYVWFDDVNWPTTKRAVTLLRQMCGEICNSGTYALFKKAGPATPARVDL